MTALEHQVKHAGEHTQPKSGDLVLAKDIIQPDARKAYLGQKYIKKSRSQSLEHMQMQTVPKDICTIGKEHQTLRRL